MRIVWLLLTVLCFTGAFAGHLTSSPIVIINFLMLGGGALVVTERAYKSECLNKNNKEVD
jgi:hypothetical protein